MSRPDGYMIKGKLYPAMSYRCEKAMAEYIEELEAALEKAQQKEEENPENNPWSGLLPSD